MSLGNYHHFLVRSRVSTASSCSHMFYFSKYSGLLFIKTIIQFILVKDWKMRVLVLTTQFTAEDDLMTQRINIVT